MTSIQEVKNILGIKQEVDLTPAEMARNLNVTFFPQKTEAPKNLSELAENLKKAFIEVGVNVIDFKDAVESPSLKKIIKRFILFFALRSRVLSSLENAKQKKDFKKSHLKKFFKFVFGKKIKKKIAVIAVGEGVEGSLPMDYTTSFKENPIITILPKNKNIGPEASFKDHMDEALKLFAWNMTNLAVCVDEKTWTVYSFNLSNPQFSLNENFTENVLNSLVPKISAPVVPPSLSEFTILENDFDPDDDLHKPFVADLVESGPDFEKTGLYPKGKKIADLHFRNYFYRWIGAIHLDERKGMSYGFLSRQMPVKIDTEVWVLTSRSGADKTKLDPKKDIIKMGLKNGKMFLSLPKGISLSADYRPSFDTRVILAHAVANAIFAKTIKSLNPQAEFPKILESNGFALAHWHGYVQKEKAPEGWIFYGGLNPSVSCSSPQTAIYAFFGKENAIMNNISKNNIDFKGEIHVEPHHGTNMSYPSLKGLASLLLSKQISKLGS